jgi:hypothetical protein
VSSTVCFVNRTDTLRNVTVWTTAVPPPWSLAGPRAAAVALGPGGVASLVVGPVNVELRTAVDGTLVAQHDGPNGADVWAVEGTPFLNRAGATAILALGLEV